MKTIIKLLRNKKFQAFLLVCMVFGGAFWWCAAIINLMFFPSWFGLMGIWCGAASFLIGMSALREIEL